MSEESRSFLKEFREKTDGIVFGVGALVTAIAIGAIALRRDAAAKVLTAANTYLWNQLSWLYLWAMFLAVLFCLWLLVGPWGKIKLGDPDENPEFTFFQFFAMLFSAGLSTGLVFYGPTEALFHYSSGPPFLSAGAQTSAIIPGAVQYTFLHWGISPWSAYLLVGITIAYYVHRRGAHRTAKGEFKRLMRSFPFPVSLPRASPAVSVASALVERHVKDGHRGSEQHLLGDAAEQRFSGRRPLTSTDDEIPSIDLLSVGHKFFSRIADADNSLNGITVVGDRRIRGRPFDEFLSDTADFIVLRKCLPFNIFFKYIDEFGTLEDMDSMEGFSEVCCEFGRVREDDRRMGGTINSGYDSHSQITNLPHKTPLVDEKRLTASQQLDQQLSADIASKTN